MKDKPKLPCSTCELEDKPKECLKVSPCTKYMNWRIKMDEWLEQQNWFKNRKYRNKLNSKKALNKKRELKNKKLDNCSICVLEKECRNQNLFLDHWRE